MVDHQALVAILDKYTLDAIDNPKIQRLKERLSPYSFTTVWRRDKDHAIPDALSRAPVNDPVADDECVGTELAYSVRNVVIWSVKAILVSEDDPASSHHLPDRFLNELRTGQQLTSLSQPDCGSRIRISHGPCTHSGSRPSILVNSGSAVHRWRYCLVRLAHCYHPRGIPQQPRQSARGSSGDCEDKTARTPNSVLAWDHQ